IKFLLGFSTACGPFSQIAISKDSQKLWDTSIYAREQAIIASNSLTDQCTSNSVTVSPLEMFTGVMDLNQLNPIFNNFPVLTRNYASLAAAVAYDRYNVRLVNMEGQANAERMPSATISQIKDAKFTELYINNLCFNIENEAVIGDMIRNTKLINFPTQVLRTSSSNYPASNIGDGGGFIQTIMSFANIKSLFVTFAMPQYPIWFFPVLFKNIDLIIDQRHVIPSAYPALKQDVCGQMFDCFVDQDVVSASPNLYHSLVFENQHVDDKNYPYGIEIDQTDGELRQVSNVFYNITLYNGTKAIKTLYPNKFMLAWKLATDDPFMRGYNSSKIGSKTNIQVQIGFTPVNNICTDEMIRPADIDQNDFKYFTSTRCYPNIKNVKLTPITLYLCDGIV
ncbi:MAG: hypothetical protein EZS28_023504, partial [Streblomastix strix]